MKKLINFLIISSILTLTACGGREGHPVMVSQYGDRQMSCAELEDEMSITEGEMQRLLPKSNKSGKNAVLGVTGFFLLVPLFFMDFKNGEKEEYEAYRQRYNRLSVLASGKKCGIKPIKYPSVDEMEKAYNEQNKGQN